MFFQDWLMHVWCSCHQKGCWPRVSCVRHNKSHHPTQTHYIPVITHRDSLYFTPKETLQLGIATLDQRYNSASMVKNHQHQTGCPFSHSLQPAATTQWRHDLWPELTLLQEEYSSVWDLLSLTHYYLLLRLCSASSREWDIPPPTHTPTSPSRPPATAPDPRVHLPVRWPGFLWNVCSRPGVAAPSSPRAVCRASIPFPDRQPAR